MFDFLTNNILPLAQQETGDNLHAFNLENAINDAHKHGCSQTCKCSKCAYLLAFEEWCQKLKTLPNSFTDLLNAYQKAEVARFDPKSGFGFIDPISPDQHNGLTGHDCNSDFDNCGAITCQGLYDNNYEPIFLVLVNPSLEGKAIQEITFELAYYIKHQIALPEPPDDAEFDDAESNLGSSNLTGCIEAKFATKLFPSRALTNHVHTSRTANPNFLLFRDKILREQDKIVWLGKNTGDFAGRQNSIKAKKKILAHLSNVGVYKKRATQPIPPDASFLEILKFVFVVVSLEQNPMGGSKFQAFQPNFCSNGDPLLWVGRPQGDGGRAVNLVHTKTCHDVGHDQCDCGASSAFEAVCSLKNISSSATDFKLLKVFVFASGEFDNYELPPLNTIKAKN